MGQTIETAKLFGQPARVLIGDPTSASGAGMNELDIVPRVEVDLEFYRQIMTNELDQMLADGVFGALKGVNVALQLADAQLTVLAAIWNEITDNVGDTKFATALANLSLPSLCIQPLTSYGNGAADARNIWVPGILPMDMSAWVYKLEETEGSKEIYTVNFRGTFRKADQNDQDFTSGYETIFMGAPSTALGGSPSSDWSLPTGY